MEHQMRGPGRGGGFAGRCAWGRQVRSAVLGARRAGAQAAADSMAAADSSSVGEAAADTAAVTPIPLQTPEDRAAEARAAAATGSMGSAADRRSRPSPTSSSAWLANEIDRLRRFKLSGYLQPR